MNYNLYKSAKFIRSINAETIQEAIKQVSEFTTNLIIVKDSLAFEWFGNSAIELIQE